MKRTIVDGNEFHVHRNLQGETVMTAIPNELRESRLDAGRQANQPQQLTEDGDKGPNVGNPAGSPVTPPQPTAPTPKPAPVPPPPAPRPGRRSAQEQDESAKRPLSDE